MWSEYWCGWHNTWSDNWWFQATMYICFPIWNNHVQRKTVEKQAKNLQYWRFHQERKCKNNHPMVPPLDHFQGKNKNSSPLARTNSASRRSFFATLTTFERRSGLKKFPFSKSWFWKWGDCQSFKVIGPVEMPILVWGRRKHPQLKWDRPKTYKFWQSPYFQNLQTPSRHQQNTHPILAF